MVIGLRENLVVEEQHRRGDHGAHGEDRQHDLARLHPAGGHGRHLVVGGDVSCGFRSIGGLDYGRPTEMVLPTAMAGEHIRHLGHGHHRFQFLLHGRHRPPSAWRRQVVGLPAIDPAVPAQDFSSLLASIGFDHKSCGIKALFACVISFPFW